MGILEGMAVGAGEALQNVGLQGVAAAIQRDRDERMSELRLAEEATIRQRGKDDAAAERGRVADYSKPIMGQVTPAATAIAESGGANDPNAPDEQYSSDVQKVSRAPTAREAQQRASAAGDLKSAETFGKDADRQEDNVRGDAKQKSDDAKWKATHEETVRFHTASIKQQAAQLGLKAKEAKDFEATVDSYMTNKSQYEMLRAEKGGDPDLIAAAKQGMEADALKLKQYRVDVGDTSDFAKRLNLSATLTSLNKTIDDVSADPATIAKAKAARDSVIEQMAALTSVKGGDETGGKSAGVIPPLAERTVGMIVDGPNGPMRWAGKGWEPVKAGDKPAAPAPAAVPAAPYVPRTEEEARLAAQGGATAGDRISGIMNSVRAIREKTGADRR